MDNIFLYIDMDVLYILYLKIFHTDICENNKFLDRATHNVNCLQWETQNKAPNEIQFAVTAVLSDGTSLSFMQVVVYPGSC